MLKGHHISGGNGGQGRSSKRSRSAQPDDNGRPNPADILLNLIQSDSSITILRDRLGTGYVQCTIYGRQEVFPIFSDTCKGWLRGKYYDYMHIIISAEAIHNVTEMLHSRVVLRNCDVVEVHIRTAGHDDSIYIDMCERKRRAIKISPVGWEIVKESPVLFSWMRGMEALPEPRGGQPIDILRPYLNCNYEDFIMTVVLTTAFIRPKGPFPVGVVLGEEGRAKSAACTIIRKLVDPHVVGARPLPKEDRTEMVRCANNWLIDHGNITTLPALFSDLFCQVSSGAGWGNRKLYADLDEVTICVARPILLNGLEEFVLRPDLADREVSIYMLPIDKKKRQTDEAFWKSFDKQYPYILGALYDLMAEAMRRLPTLNLKERLRMADFSEWGEAIGRAMGLHPGDFIGIYEKNRQRRERAIVDNQPVVRIIRKFLRDRACSRDNPWEGTWTDLLNALNNIVDDATAENDKWPKTAKGLSTEMDKVLGSLRKSGICFERDLQRHEDGKHLKLWEEYRPPTDVVSD
jgi:hypothetical protein